MGLKFLFNRRCRAAKLKHLLEEYDMSNLESISVYKPIGWNFNSLANSKTPKYQNRKVEQITHFVSMMLTKNLYQKKPFNTPVNLHTDVLRGMYGRRVKEEIIDPLTKAKLLQVQDTYSAGNFSKSYALRLEGHTRLEQVTLVDELLIERINGISKRRTDTVLKNYPESQIIYHSLTRTSVDYYPCLNAINKKFNVSFLQELRTHLIERYGVDGADSLHNLLIKANAYKGDFKRTLKSQIKRKYNLTADELNKLMMYTTWFTTHQTYLVHLNKWRELSNADIENKKNHIWFKTDKSGRVHHNATSTPKIIRQHLRLEDEEFVEIDASNSQWFMLVAYLRKAEEETVQHILYNHIKNRKGKGRRGETQPPKPHHLMLDTFYKELDRLQSLLEKGAFRKVMTLKVSQLQNTPVAEGDVKGLLLKRILFEDPDKAYMKNEPIVQVFKDAFPTLYKAIVSLKKGGIDYTVYGYNEKNSYKALAVELQRMESEVFIRGVHKHLDGVLRLSIHDALLLRKKDVKRGLDALQIACKDKWGINLKVTLSNYQKG